jgi:hypothetical protein
MKQVPQLVDELPDSFALMVGGRLTLKAFISRDRFRDGRIEAAIQGVELLRLDRGFLLDRKLRDGLADVAVVVDDLRDRVAFRQ